MTNSTDNDQGFVDTGRCEQLHTLSREHDDCILFADKIAKIADEGSESDLAEGIKLIKEYNDNELEAHLQHEEQAIFAPIIQEYREHLDLCITLGKEHGFLRTIVDEIKLDTARQDLADFALVLRNHTLVEESKLFPLLASLFTNEQLDNVKNFVPLDRREITHEPRKSANKSINRSNHHWLTIIEQYFQKEGGSVGTIVLFPRYQPDFSMMMAAHLGLELFDFQKEMMQKLGTEADSISLDQLEYSLRARAEKSGIVSHNVEALLGVKSVSERRRWLRSFVESDWPNPIIIPISVFQADAPEEHQRVCDLELEKMPYQASAAGFDAESRIKYNLPDYETK